MTYSFTQGFLNGIDGLSKGQIKSAVEKAFSVFAKYVPIKFVETTDRGASTQTLRNQYVSAGNEAKLRFHRDNIDGKGNTVAEAYFPNEDASIAGDIFFDNEKWDPGLFVETVLHEVGHALGMEHVSGVNAIMNPTLKRRFSSINDAELLQDDIRTIRRAYGSGKGSVKPLGGTSSGSPSKSSSGTNSSLTIRGTSRDDRLVGNYRSQKLYGGGGNDTLLGESGNDRLYGGPGSDRLLGGNGIDHLHGTWNGKGEKDILTGGSNRDVFVLGTNSSSYYNDSNSKTVGTKDFALLTDFRRSQGDVIQLSDKFDYRLGTTAKRGDSEKALFIDNPAGQSDELIAIVRGLGDLGLNSSAFRYV